MIKFIDEKNTYIDESVKVGEGTVIYPNVYIIGNTVIGNNNTIYPGTLIINSIIGDNNIIYNSQILNSEIGNDCNIGPYANIREENIIKDNVKIGSFVEIKKTFIDNNSRVPHLTYLGDTNLGENVNIGCGVITANFDGIKKNKTIIEKNAFIGCGVNLIAPLIVGENSIIGAGSTIAKNIPKNALAIAREKMVIKEDYNK